MGCNCGGGGATATGTFEVTYPTGQKVVFNDFVSVKVAIAANPGATWTQLKPANAAA